MQKVLEALNAKELPTFKTFWAWVKESFTTSYVKEIEEYLSQSTDVVDLKRRMEVLQRRGMI